MKLIKPPFSSKLPEFRFPVFRQDQLSNGIPVFQLEANTQPLVFLRMGMKTGAYHEQTEGLGYVTAKMLTRGTKSRSSFKIASQAEQLGTSLSPAGHWDDTSFNMTCLAENFQKSLGLLADCINEPKFAPVEFNKYKKKHLANLQTELDDPDYICQLAYNSALFKGTAYSHPLMGTTKSIGLINSDSCKNWHNKLITESGIFFTISGSITHLDLLNELDKHFGSLKQVNTFKPFSEKALNNSENRAIISRKDDSEQTTLKIGFCTINKQHDDYPLLHLANVIFGGYFQSRLNSILREKRGLTYGVSSNIDTKKYNSALTVSTAINKKSTAESVKVILDEIQNFHEKPVKPTELQKAAQYLMGSFLRHTESHRQSSSMMYAIESGDLRRDYYDYLFEQISSAKVEDLFEIQQKYFKSGNIVISATGDLDYLNRSLLMFGKPEIYEF